MRALHILTLISLLGLSGCSYAFDVQAVMITSGATGYGGGRFRLPGDGRVENLGPPKLMGEDAPLVTPSR